MTENTALRGHPDVGPNTEGIALVFEEGFSARYDDDRHTGVISRETHALYGVRRMQEKSSCSARPGAAWPRRG